MIEQILPSLVKTAEHYGDDDPTLVVHPLEETLIAKAIEKRKREFITTRALAHDVIRKLGAHDEPIMRDAKGAPLWPSGICGSLTHCKGYRAAVGAHSLYIRSLGIDAEVHEPLPQGVLKSISLPQECKELATLDPSYHWDRVLFCAKEAVYKTWFPITGRWLGFEDAHIEISPDGDFHAEILIDGTPRDGGEYIREFNGKWLCEKGLILTAISL